MALNSLDRYRSRATGKIPFQVDMQRRSNAVSRLAPRDGSQFTPTSLADMPTVPGAGMATGGDSMTPGLAPVTTREAAPSRGSLGGAGRLTPYGTEGVATPEGAPYGVEEILGSNAAGSLVSGATTAMLKNPALDYGIQKATGSRGMLGVLGEVLGYREDSPQAIAMRMGQAGVPMGFAGPPGGMSQEAYEVQGAWL